MPIQTQIWVNDIKEQLFPSNAFISEGEQDDSFVNNLTVNLPQSGALPTVERNRSVLPATAAQRTDTVATYDIAEYTSTPTVIRDIEEVETSYDKRASVLRMHVAQLNVNIANWMQYDWGATTAANIVRTTGANRAAQVTAATGTRKLLTLTDIFAAKSLLDDMDAPEEGRVMLIPAYMYNDLLLTEKDTLLSLEFTNAARMENGVLTSLLGFRIYKRGKKNVLSYTNAATPVLRAPGAADLTTANAAVLAWHPMFTRRALGAVKVFSHEDDPTWYGSTFSTLARAGGRKAYTDETGVVSIVEAAGA